MRRLLLCLAVVFCTMAASRATAVNLPFTGTLTLDLLTLDPIVVSGSGTAVVNGSSAAGPLTAVDLAAGEFSVAGLVVPITDPLAFPIRGEQITVQNQAGHFDGVANSGGFGGTMSLPGFIKVCLFGPCDAAVSNLNVPLAPIGAGGYAIVTAANNLTVVGAPWTTGTAAVGTVTAMGGISSAGNTESLSLVTPVWISTSIGASPVVPLLAFLDLALLNVPEPSTLLMFASGIVGLVAFGRSRSG